ncbi:MAG: DUF4011 domain-containing protein [Clostridiales bacterium]|nr:DUF4011 domain-containing protein [Clostridiales bacterium]
MAGSKTKNTLHDKVELILRAPKCVGYIDYAMRTPITVQVKNAYTEAVELKVTISDKEGLIVPYETQINVPFESAVEVTAEGVFSPLFLAENMDVKDVPFEVVVFDEKGKKLVKKDDTVTALPYDYWEGVEGNAERLAGFVRPRLADRQRILTEAGKRLKKWNAEIEFSGYTGADKNTVRQIMAAVYASVKNLAITKTGKTDLTVPVCAVGSESVYTSRQADSLELAVYVAACLEAARLHPVIALGKNSVAVGVWLYETCFLDTVTDDVDIVAKYVTDGINNLCFFDIEDLFGTKSVAFTPSEKHFADKLKGGYYEYFVDIRRCRMAGINPLPLRGKGVRGYELISETDSSDDNAPTPLKEYKKIKLEGKPSKNGQWERRLLDLTGKNTLLNFYGKNALHICCSDVDSFYARFADIGEMRLKAGTETVEPFGSEPNAAAKELIELEQKKKLLRVYADKETVSETARWLLRKNREADEETGAKILYLAMGFLKYLSKEDGHPKYAPLVLVPVGIKRAKGGEDFSVEGAEEEYFVNSTLLEYLKQEFNIDIRGLGGDISALKISEILAMVLAETATMKGWAVVKDVYLATFSFQRYLMWHDLHAHFDDLKDNAVVSALLKGRMEYVGYPDVKEEDEGDPVGTLIPLPADSSQYSAIALSRAGASFVLHGPPGTGKSQTITNIIANAVEDGKRVLFVAEKKAALDVVKKRLDNLGIGEFCLELHSNKTDKSDVLRRMETTLALAKEEPVTEFIARADEILSLRDELIRPMLALHKKRRLGISVYQAILAYLKNKDAPDVLGIESTFYDSLDERRLSECRNRILTAAAAAKECGGVHNSPFDNVNVLDYSQELRDRIFCSCQVMIAEIKHLKGFLALFLEFYRQKISTITQKKLENIATIARNLSNGAYGKYFAGITEEQFYVFYNANRRLDDCLKYYYKHFKSLVDVGKEYSEVKKVLDEGGDYRLNATAMKILKKLSKVAVRPISEDDERKFLQTVVDIYDSIERIKSVSISKNFCDRNNDIVFKRREEFLRDLYALHELSATTFMDYNPDAFNGMCMRSQSGYTLPILDGYIKAVDAFFHAQERFIEITNGDKSKLTQEDVLDYYSLKAGTLIDNIDMLANWCMYRQTRERLRELGCTFVTEALEEGKLTGENILSGFEKNVYKNFLEINIPADPELSRMTVGTLEDTVEKFRIAWEEFSRITRQKIRSDLISRLPAEDCEGSISLEVASFKHHAKSNLRGVALRSMFSEIPELIQKISPCMLMSPVTVAQYLKPEANLFDLVIFDEASQMNTAEAIGSIARAKAAIIVGDPKQLPPTSFFHSGYVDEDNLENEDLESILDECLALGMPERHLRWHYRSKHESLIAFSNSMYYGNRLCTFPSPDAIQSKVRLVQVDGTYDRGFTKRNRKESEALVAEVVRRLKDPVLSRSSMGIVTFSGAQQSDIEKLLTKTIASKKLENVAYDREEPLFVKNLENVQGDERDVILFSVCYGPDAAGKVSLNFGPLNHSGGWRRLNVAVSRAREEMVIFSSMTSGMINLAKVSSKGVAGLKAFLEFAEKGRTTLAAKPTLSADAAGIGKYIAKELKGYGYDSRVDVGASDFKIDVAVIDPRNKHDFILAIVSDATDKFSVKDKNILQVQTLKRANWNVLRVNCVNYFNNPKREIKRIKETLDKLTGAEKRSANWLAKYGKTYKALKTDDAQVATFITGGDNDTEIMNRLKQIVAIEEPISRTFLKTRCLNSFGITKSGSRIDARLDALIDACAFSKERVFGVDYLYKKDSALSIGKFRVESGVVLRKSETDFTPFEIVSMTKAILEERVSIYLDELISILLNTLKLRPSEKFTIFTRDCISYGEQKGILLRSVSDRISLA